MSLLQQTAIENRSRELARAHPEGGEGSRGRHQPLRSEITTMSEECV